MRYVSNGQPWGDAQTHQFVERQRAGFATRAFCLWKLVLRQTGELAGMCGLQPLVDTPDIEIGWWLAPELWGQGIATEAARRALAYGFERAHLAQIVSIALPENRGSIRIMEKLGMKFEGNVNHKGYEVVRYVIRRAEFEATASSETRCTQ